MAALGRQKPRTCSSETQGSNGGRTATFALSKNCSEEEAKELRALLHEDLLSNQSKSLAKKLCVEIDGCLKNDDRVERILVM